MQTTITDRLISILTETEKEIMYHNLAVALGKTGNQSEMAGKLGLIKELPELKIELGTECKRKRDMLGLTIYAVAKTSGILQNQVKAIEEGQGYNIDALLKLTKALDLHVILADSDKS